MDPKDLQTRLEKIYDAVSRIDVTLARQAVTLEDHTRRSLANEEALDLIRAEMAPLKAHVALWGALGKIISVAGTLLAALVTLLKLSGRLG